MQNSGKRQMIEGIRTKTKDRFLIGTLGKEERSWIPD
jgi:hypothetical protein